MAAQAKIIDMLLETHRSPYRAKIREWRENNRGWSEHHLQQRGSVVRDLQALKVARNQRGELRHLTLGVLLES
jgi:hypothetical protein